MFRSIHEQHEAQRRMMFAYLDSDDFINFKKLSDYLGADVVLATRDVREGFEGKTFLHSAARMGRIDFVSYLIDLQHPIDPFDCSCTKLTPLMEAIQGNFIETAILLIESGASVSYQDINMENAFHYAARNGSSKMIKLMIKAAGISKDEIKGLLSVTDIKRRFPEDLATKSLAREVLLNFRQLGEHPQYKRVSVSHFNTS